MPAIAECARTPRYRGLMQSGSDATDQTGCSHISVLLQKKLKESCGMEYLRPETEC